MVVFKLLFAHTIVAGLLGVLANLYISAFLLSTESIDSPKPVRRWVFRYLIFSVCYLASMLITPAITKPALDALAEVPGFKEFAYQNVPLFFGSAIPLAIALYFFNRWFMIRFDAAKVNARAKLLQKFHRKR